MRASLAVAFWAIVILPIEAEMPPLPAAVKNLAPNPSFEDGTASPQGWANSGAATWSNSVARSGRRSLAATKASGPSWHSEPIKVEPGWSYRLNGWISCRSGDANLGMDLLDERGETIGTSRAPSPAVSSNWQFTAVEADLPAQCRGVRLWLLSSGEAYLDDVVLVPTTINLVYNPTFESNPKRRVTFWDPAPRDAFDGTQMGTLSPVAQDGRDGAALRISAAGGWQGARNLDTTLPEGINRFKLDGWAKPAAGECFVVVGWLDSLGKFVRRDKIESAESVNGWLHLAGIAQRPPDATMLKLMAMARNGESLFDDFAFYADTPARHVEPVMKVLVNQIGYELAGPKSIVVATNFFPTNSTQGTLEIVSESGESVAQFPLHCNGRVYDGNPNDWGSYFWRADVSSFHQPGTYRAIANIGQSKGQSPRFEIASGILLDRTSQVAVDFFYIQRCGFEVPGWHKACHLDDARLPDGTHIDAMGGWHSAGDYNKLMYENGDGGVAYALCKAFDAAPSVFSRFDRNADSVPDAIDEATWGAAFVAKMQDPKTGDLYKDIRQGPARSWMKWSTPDSHTDNIAGTADDPVIDAGEGHSPLVIGVWAELSKVVDRRGQKNDYLERAVKLFNHAIPDGKPTTSPHLLLSAIDLYKTTNEDRYLDFVRGSVAKILESQTRAGRMTGAFGSYGQWEAGALATLALTYPQDPLVPQIRESLGDYTTFCLTTTDNSFGLSKESVGTNEYFFHPNANLGVNFLYLGRAWAAGLVYQLTSDERALRFATDQIDWVMGKNPFGLCMIEGVGTNNPHWYHHRYDTIPGRKRGAVPGAVPNGFVVNLSGLDVPNFDMTFPGAGQRDHPSYRTSEPWLVHNMHLLLALTALSPTRKAMNAK